MKYVIAAAIVFIVVMGLFGWAVCIASSRSDERHEQMMRLRYKQYRDEP